MAEKIQTLNAHCSAKTLGPTTLKASGFTKIMYCSIINSQWIQEKKETTSIVLRKQYSIAQISFLYTPKVSAARQLTDAGADSNCRLIVHRTQTELNSNPDYSGEIQQNPNTKFRNSKV